MVSSSPIIPADSYQRCPAPCHRLPPSHPSSHLPAESDEAVGALLAAQLVPAGGGGAASSAAGSAGEKAASHAACACSFFCSQEVASGHHEVVGRRHDGQAVEAGHQAVVHGALRATQPGEGVALPVCGQGEAPLLPLVASQGWELGLLGSTACCRLATKNPGAMHTRTTRVRPGRSKRAHPPCCTPRQGRPSWR